MRDSGMNDEDRAGIRADRIKRPVAERDLSVIADENVQPEQRDRIDQHVGEPE
jgi:hypothetical protein